MKYVALLSGGKDSCFNLLHCQKNGHQIVAAASLGPQPGKDELDSYMYQTVGQDAIELVAQALDVHLYRRIISGDAVQQGSEYGGRSASEAGGVQGDETEDLYELLTNVLEHHPEVKGVSVGAILSNYQRVRVEHVCRRLSLTPLCYLWQRDQSELLSEMIEAGLTAVLIKVAGIGLTPKHLGKTLGEMQPTLMKLNSLYGSHVCGEGGEYETLTIDSPMFKSRIILEELETVIHSDNDFATVAYLRVKKGSMEAKETHSTLEGLAVPKLLEGEHKDVEQALLNTMLEVRDWPQLPSFKYSFLESRSNRVGDWISISNVQRSSSSREPISLEAEVEECFKKIEDELQKFSLSVVNCANINIMLSSMDLFGKVNEMYAKFFGTSPPARACVAARLPPDIRVRLEATAYAEKAPSARQALHVQGLSYWAPANIGPYSQAVLASNQIFVSGQIGLVPSSLSLANSFPLQTALARQHVTRVVKALSETSGSWAGYPQLILYWMDQIIEPADILLRPETGSQIPSLCVVVDSLPKGATVEKQVLYHTGRYSHLDEDNEEVVETKEPTCKHSKINCPAGGVIATGKCCNSDGSSVVLICVKGDISGYESRILCEVPKATLSARLFQVPTESCLKIQKILEGELTLPTTQIPCRRISTKGESDWDCAMIFYAPGASMAV
ncbi:meiotically up-regulated 71 protein [Coprinopsis sp. MPI-PUGE-AT-0042]|nr:meiotically up-regulated 71 protein [Coprinopsis sp. MPI-PUGE-AT-0042]